MPSETAPDGAPAKPAKKGSRLGGKWHGVPVPLLAVGGGVGILLVYRWYKNRQSSSSSSTATPATAASPFAATGDTTGTGSGYTGGGSAGGGGFGGWGGGTTPTPPDPLSTAPPPSTPGPPAAPDASTPPPAVAPVAASPAPSAPGQPVAQGGVPFNYVRTFTPSGSSRVYYALGNPNEVAAAKAAGYTVVGGRTLSGGNPSANYAYK